MFLGGAIESLAFDPFGSGLTLRWEFGDQHYVIAGHEKMKGTGSLGVILHVPTRFYARVSKPCDVRIAEGGLRVRA